MTASPVPSGSNRPSGVQDGIFSDRRVLLLIMLFGFSGALVVILAVVSGATALLDTSIFAALRDAGPWSSRQAPEWLREAMRDITAFGGLFALTSAVVAGAAFLIASGKVAVAGLLVCSAVGATMLSTAIKQLVERARPDVAGRLVAVFNPSFPSGHALLSAAIILSLGGLIAFALKRRAQKLVVLLAAGAMCIAVGLSRIWLGVHWPSDVLAGWLLGAAWAASTLLLAQRIGREQT